MAKDQHLEEQNSEESNGYRENVARRTFIAACMVYTRLPMPYTLIFVSPVFACCVHGCRQTVSCHSDKHERIFGL